MAKFSAARGTPTTISISADYEAQIARRESTLVELGKTMARETETLDVLMPELFLCSTGLTLGAFAKGLDLTRPPTVVGCGTGSLLPLAPPSAENSLPRVARLLPL